jgi:WD40 repeat protein
LTTAAIGGGPRTIQAHDADAWRTAFSADGRRLATASSRENSLKLWDVASGKLAQDFGRLKSGIFSLCLTADGEQLITGSSTRVQCWDAATGELKRTIELPSQVSDVALSPDESMIAVAFREDRFVGVFSRQGAEPIQVLEVPMDGPRKGSGGIGQVCFSPDGEVLVAATGGRGWPDFRGDDAAMAVWNTSDWTLRASYVADSHNVNSLAISPDSRTIAASCHRSRVVKVWDMPAASRPGKEAPAPEIRDLIAQLDSDSFARREAAQARLGEIGAAATEALQGAVRSGTPEQRIRAGRLLRPITGGDIRPRRVLRGSGGDMQAVAFSPDGQLLAIGSMVAQPRNVLLYRLGGPPAPIVVPVKNGAWDIAFSPDGKLLATGSADGTVTLSEVGSLLVKE